MPMGGVELSDSHPLFRGQKAGGLSYSRWRELLHEKLSELGYQSDEFGIHSLCTGRATTAANAGVLDRLFKWHGCWKSKGAKDRYVDGSLDTWFEVARHLGL